MHTPQDASGPHKSPCGRGRSLKNIKKLGDPPRKEGGRLMHTKVPMCTSRKSVVWSRCNSCTSQVASTLLGLPKIFSSILVRLSFISIMKAITSNIRLMYPSVCVLIPGVACTQCRMKAYYASIGKPACTLQRRRRTPIPLGDYVTLRVHQFSLNAR